MSENNDTQIKDIRDKMVVKNSSKHLYDWTRGLSAHDMNESVSDIVIKEFIKKVECENEGRVFIPNPSTDSLFLSNPSKFNLNRFNKFRMDNVNGKRLKKQLEILGEWRKNEMGEIETYVKLLNINHILDGTNTNIPYELLDDENEMFINKLQRLNVGKNKQEEMSREMNVILGIIRKKRKNLQLLEEIMTNIVTVIKEGEKLGDFIKEVDDKLG